MNGRRDDWIFIPLLYIRFTIFQRTLKLLIVLCQSANSHDEIVQNLQAMARKLLIESCLIVVQPPCLLFRIRELANDNSKTNDDNEQMQTLIIRMQKLYDSSKNPSTKKTTNAQGAFIYLQKFAD